MRKLNSSFKTAFISEPGAALKNNQYFAFVELDDYACYVIANSITDLTESESAQVAVESIIRHFQENPSMRKRALLSYIKEANEDLLNSHSIEHLKASVTVVITNYEKIRYGIVGNTRFRLYREGVPIIRSSDLSLSQDYVEEEHITPNVLSKHEERHNLYTYLGQEADFNPYISSSLALKDGDIIVLYTHGIWENLDEAELDDVFSESTDDPKASLDEVEDMLLSKQPENLENYTISAIFADKVFTDPNRKRRIRRIIKIAIIVFIILFILGTIGYIWYSRHQSKVDDMNLRTENTVECIKNNNYIRAQGEAQKGLDDAEYLNDKEKITLLNNYLRLIDAVIDADNKFQDKNYTDAYEAYHTALECSRQADNLGETYIKRRIEQCENFLSVSDLIGLGDKLMETGDYDKAEDRYIEARKLAIRLHDADGKQQAKEALEKLYDEKKKNQDELDKQAQQQVSDDIADLLAEGDTLQANGDYAGAEAKYQQARMLAAQNYNNDGRKDAFSAMDRLNTAKAKAETEEQVNKDEYTKQYQTAAVMLARGDDAFYAKDYAGANVFYNTALEKYTALGDSGMVQSIGNKLQQVAIKRQEIVQQEQNATSLEQQASNLYRDKEYVAAKKIYMQAQQAYISMGHTEKSDEIQKIIDQIDIDAAVAETL